MQATVLPARPQTVHYDAHQFEVAPNKERFNTLREKMDYTLFGTRESGNFQNVRGTKLFQARHTAAPVWAVNNALLQLTIVRFIENQVGLGWHVQLGDYATRLERVYATQAAQRPNLNETLTRLCKAYVAEKAAGATKKRLKTLSEEIENLDTRLMFGGRRGVAVFTAAVCLYYRNGFNSPQVAAALGLKPPHVRTLMHRLKKVWEQINDVENGTERVLRTIKKIQQAKGVPQDEQVKARPACGPHKHSGGPLADLRGKRYGKLVVLERIDANACQVKCDCGNTKVVRTSNLRQGNVQSCGCLRREAALARWAKAKAAAC